MVCGPWGYLPFIAPIEIAFVPLKRFLKHQNKKDFFETAFSNTPRNHVINTELPWAEEVFFLCIILDYKLWFKAIVTRCSVAAAKVTGLWEMS